MITVERYLKVVYPVWSNNNLRDWMIYLATAFAWTYSIVLNFAIVLSTSTVIDGVCYAYTFWKNETYSIFVLFFNFLSFYVVILFIFIFCYWRILSVIRRQARVMAGQDDDTRQRILRRVVSAKLYIYIAWHFWPPESKFTFYHFWQRLLRVSICRVSVHLHQSVYLRHQVRSGQASPSSSDSMQEDTRGR